MPVFINGLGNDIVADVRSHFRSDVRRTNPVIPVLGDPVDYSDLQAQTPRPARNKKAADRFRDAIIVLSKRERELLRELDEVSGPAVLPKGGPSVFDRLRDLFN